MYPTTYLQPGERGIEVTQLQNFLKSQGFLDQNQIDADNGYTSTIYGTYDVNTKQAVENWQEMNGVDNTSGPGYWGPRSIAAASGETTNQSVVSEPTPYAGGLAPDDPSNRYNTRTGELNPNYRDNSDQPYSNNEYSVAVADNPVVREYIKSGNTVEEIENAAETGDLSNINDQNGQPFSLEDQQAALAKAEEDTKLYYDALKSKETADTESALAKQKADYQNYLLNSGQQFESDKSKADQSAANRGVLFSGGRVQREKNLARAYEQDQAAKQATLGRNVSDIARDYQYKYGNKPANNLSRYYSLEGNTYNPHAARSNVGTTSLSSIYNPNKYNYQGTRNVARKGAATTRSAKALWNKGNKLLATGYKNQY